MSRLRKAPEDIRERLQKILEVLQHRYPQASLALSYDNGFELLVAVMLSAQCTDERVNQVTGTLFKKYKSPEDYLQIAREQLEEEIRPAGFYRNKAKSLQDCCRVLVEQFGGEVPQDIEQLVQLPGVGRKTAAMVLGNAYGLHQGIAVDTHVSRVAQRVQLSSAKTVEKIERDLMQLVPRERWTWFSNAVILHGRETCTARKPRCTVCVIEPWCLFPEKNL